MVQDSGSNPGSGSAGSSGSSSGANSGSGGGGTELVVSRSGGSSSGSAPLPSRTYTRDAGNGQIQTCIDSPVPETGNATNIGAQEFCGEPFTPADPAAPVDPDAPPAPGPPPVVITPEQLAQIAVSQLEVPTPEIGMVPERGPGKMGTVGVPVWLWTDPVIWEPQSATAALAGLSVTATSSLADVTWDMGDGTTVTCTVPGTPYQPSYGMEDSPDCGHTYQQTSADQPGLEYPITAIARYEVVWTGDAEGSDTLTASSATSTPVGEYQVIVTN